MTVSELLKASRVAHERGRQVTSGKGPTRRVVRPPDLVAWAEAYRLRQQAVMADPEHKDVDWTEDEAAGFPHEAMMNFYEEKLG